MREREREGEDCRFEVTQTRAFARRRKNIIFCNWIKKSENFVTKTFAVVVIFLANI